MKKVLSLIFLIVTIINGHLSDFTIQKSPNLENELAQIGVEIEKRYKPLETRSHSLKDWTFIVYIAADNDLRTFVMNNIKQLTQIGSNEYITLVAHLDIRLQGNKKVTRRYLIEKNKVILLNDETQSPGMDSGDPNTLISSFNWAKTSFPAKEYALILWNHGTGVIDPGNSKIINPSVLFNFNPQSQKLELDRSIGFIDLVELLYSERGICWDNTTGNYLTNQKLEQALSAIYQLNDNQKISIIGFDACLMSMIEIGNIVKKYAHIMVGSQEVELGTGWNYSMVLAPFTQHSLSRTEFARHIVQAYKQTYEKITNDFTQSALDLGIFSELESNIDTIGQLLLECLKDQHGTSTRNVINTCKHKKNCTHFDEPSYIDLHNMYTNLLNNVHLIQLKHNQHLKIKLKESLEQGIRFIEKLVIANVAGKNLSGAHGISVYFPDKRFHPSYLRSQFAQSNRWAQMLVHVINE